MSDEQVVKKIEDVLSEIRPNIQMDGGDVEFVSFSEGIVFLKFVGSCTNCPDSLYDLKINIEQKLREFVPDIQEVQVIK